MPERRGTDTSGTVRPDAPEVLPTVLPTVREVLRMEPLASGLPEVLTGRDALGAPVRWVHVAETAEAARLAHAEPDNAEAQELAVEAFNEAANAATATAPPPPPPPKNLRGGYSTLGSYVKWKFEVVAPSAVPPEHLMPNEKSIGAAVQAEAQLAKAQGREFKLEIPGVRIYSDEIAVSR